MGLEFDHPQGAKFVMRRLYEHGVWAIFSTLDPRVLQFKPGILLGPDLCEEVLDRTEVAIGRARRRGARPGWTRERADERSSARSREPAGVPRARLMLAAGPTGRRAPSRLRPRRVAAIVEAVAEAA